MDKDYRDVEYNDSIPEKQSLLINEETVKEKEENLKVYYEVSLVVLPLFCGYACLFALQREVKKIYNIKDDNSQLSHLYGVAASLVYIGNLVFRLGHNILFSFFYPRTRVVISMLSMATSMGIITCIFFFMKDPSIVFVFIAYGLGGLGIGTFESNLLSTISVLGKKTKLWAIIGIPVGINIITVGGFILLELGLFPGYIYLGVLIFHLIGIALYFYRIFWDAGIGNNINLLDFLHQLKQWRQWFPTIKWNCLALAVDMLCVSMFSPGLILYMYDEDYVYFGSNRLATNWMFAIYDLCFFLGDTSSRKLVYMMKTISPFLFLILAFIGVACGMVSKFFMPLIFLCPLFISFCNGSIYSQSNRHIDTKVPKEFSLISFSFWLFLGDVGSVVGSNLISYVNVAVKNLYH